MLLHLGEDRVIRLLEVEAVLDYGLFRKHQANKEFLGLARSEGRLESQATGQGPESVVLAGERVLLSSLSRHALARRAKLVSESIAARGVSPPLPGPGHRGKTPS